MEYRTTGRVLLIFGKHKPLGNKSAMSLLLLLLFLCRLCLTEEEDEEWPEELEEERDEDPESEREPDPDEGMSAQNLPRRVGSDFRNKNFWSGCGATKCSMGTTPGSPVYSVMPGGGFPFLPRGKRCSPRLGALFPGLYRLPRKLIFLTNKVRCVRETVFPSDISHPGIQ